MPHSVGYYYSQWCCCYRYWFYSSKHCYWQIASESFDRFAVWWSEIESIRAILSAPMPVLPLKSTQPTMLPSRDDRWCVGQSHERTPRVNPAISDTHPDPANIQRKKRERKQWLRDDSFKTKNSTIFQQYGHSYTSLILICVAISWIRWIVSTWPFHKISLPNGFPQHFWFSWLTIFCSCIANPLSTLIFCWLSLTRFWDEKKKSK